MTTKTATTQAVDPVTAAEQRLATAEQALADAKAEADLVYAAMLAGEPQVTAEKFAGVRHAVEHAAMLRDAASASLTQARAAARLDRIRGIVSPIIQGNPADAKHLEEAAAQIESGVRAIIEVCTRQRADIYRAIAALRREGVPQSLTTRRDPSLESQHAGVTFADASWGKTERVIVDGQTIAAPNSAAVIRDAMRRGAVQRPGVLIEIGNPGSF